MDAETVKIIRSGVIFAIVVMLTLFLIGRLFSRSSDTTVVYLIYADWCPACQQLKPVWESLKPRYGEHMRELNSDNTTELNAFRKRYNVDIIGYPTIMTIRNGQARQYTGSRDPASMEKLVSEKCCI